MPEEALEHGASGLIEAVLLLIGFVLVMVAIYSVVTLVREERLTEGSAINLTNAINEVYECAVVNQGAECETRVRTTITLDQPNPKPSKDDDPRWIVYWKRDPDKNPYREYDHSSDEQVGGGEDETRAIFVTEAETSGAVTGWCGPDNTKGVCHGAVERNALESKGLFADRDGNPDAVKNFWLISPCYAEIEAYWEDDKVKIEFVENRIDDVVLDTRLIDKRPNYNFCCDDNGDVRGEGVFEYFDELLGRISGHFDTEWPENGDAFCDSGGCGSGAHDDKGEPLNGCDFND